MYLTHFASAQQLKQLRWRKWLHSPTRTTGLIVPCRVHCLYCRYWLPVVFLPTPTVLNLVVPSTVLLTTQSCVLWVATRYDRWIKSASKYRTLTSVGAMQINLCLTIHFIHWGTCAAGSLKDRCWRPLKSCSHR